MPKQTGGGTKVCHTSSTDLKQWMRQYRMAYEVVNIVLAVSEEIGRCKVRKTRSQNFLEAQRTQFGTIKQAWQADSSNQALREQFRVAWNAIGLREKGIAAIERELDESHTKLKGALVTLKAALQRTESPDAWEDPKALSERLWLDVKRFQASALSLLLTDYTTAMEMLITLSCLPDQRLVQLDAQLKDDAYAKVATGRRLTKKEMRVLSFDALHLWMEATRLMRTHGVDVTHAVPYTMRLLALYLETSQFKRSKAAQKCGHLVIMARFAKVMAGDKVCFYINELLEPLRALEDSTEVGDCMIVQSAVAFCGDFHRDNSTWAHAEAFYWRGLKSSYRLFSPLWFNMVLGLIQVYQGSEQRGALRSFVHGLSIRYGLDLAVSNIEQVLPVVYPAMCGRFQHHDQEVQRLVMMSNIIRMLIACGRFVLATDFTKLLTSQVPKSVEAQVAVQNGHKLHVKALLKGGYFQETLDYTRQILQEPSLPFKLGFSMQFYRGHAHSASGDLGAARASYDQALQMAQSANQAFECLEVHRFLGHIASQQGAWSLACEHFQAVYTAYSALSEAQQQSVAISGVWLAWGRALEQQHPVDIERVRQHWQQALAFLRTRPHSDHRVLYVAYYGDFVSSLARLCKDQKACCDFYLAQLESVPDGMEEIELMLLTRAFLGAPTHHYRQQVYLAFADFYRRYNYPIGRQRVEALVRGITPPSISAYVDELEQLCLQWGHIVSSVGRDGVWMPYVGEALTFNPFTQQALRVFLTSVYELFQRLSLAISDHFSKEHDDPWQNTFPFKPMIEAKELEAFLVAHPWIEREGLAPLLWQTQNFYQRYPTLPWQILIHSADPGGGYSGHVQRSDFGRINQVWLQTADTHLRLFPHSWVDVFVEQQDPYALSNHVYQLFERMGWLVDGIAYRVSGPNHRLMVDMHQAMVKSGQPFIATDALLNALPKEEQTRKSIRWNRVFMVLQHHIAVAAALREKALYPSIPFSSLPHMLNLLQDWLDAACRIGAQMPRRSLVVSGPSILISFLPQALRLGLIDEASPTETAMGLRRELTAIMDQLENTLWHFCSQLIWQPNGHWPKVGFKAVRSMLLTRDPTTHWSQVVEFCALRGRHINAEEHFPLFIEWVKAIRRMRVWTLAERVLRYARAGTIRFEIQGSVLFAVIKDTWQHCRTDFIPIPAHWIPESFNWSDEDQDDLVPPFGLSWHPQTEHSGCMRLAPLDGPEVLLQTKKHPQKGWCILRQQFRRQRVRYALPNLLSTIEGFVGDLIAMRRHWCGGLNLHVPWFALNARLQTPLHTACLEKNVAQIEALSHDQDSFARALLVEDVMGHDPMACAQGDAQTEQALIACKLALST